jgi:hypothetical protein
MGVDNGCIGAASRPSCHAPPAVNRRHSSQHLSAVGFAFDIGVLRGLARLDMVKGR